MRNWIRIVRRALGPQRPVGDAPRWRPPETTASSPSHASTTTKTGEEKQITIDPAQLSLHGPLGLVLAPNGDLIFSNGDAVSPANTGSGNSLLVEITPQGKFVADYQIDPGTGAPFGIALSLVNGELRFAAVEDATNTLDLQGANLSRSLHMQAQRGISGGACGLAEV